MKSITNQKSTDEIKEDLNKLDKIFIIGCGTCTTQLKTGGIDQVLEMKTKLEEAGITVTGWMVIPIACDEMTDVAMKEHKQAIQSADGILSMSCAQGTHRMSLYIDKPVIPALNTLFISLEESPGTFREVCAQCGQCILGETAGICPMTACHKGLVNGPCGGTNDGKCEVDKNMDCAWTLIYNRLKAQGRLELMRKHQLPRNYHATLRPKVLKIQ